MKIIQAIAISVALIFGLHSYGQSDGCSFSPALTVTSNCSAPTIGSSAGASETIPGCSGNADDDVWYEFVATSNSHEITVGASASYDPVLQVFSNTCSSLISLGCTDNFGTGSDETFTYTSFTPGQTYKIRVYHWGTGSGSNDFTICVTNPPAPPANDACSGAVALNVNGTCTPQSFSNSGATNSLAGCSGNADDDVWFSFVATNAVQDISVEPQGNMDLVVQLFEGTCGALNSVSCEDNTFSGGTETINAVGLTPGQIYYFRVYDYYTGTTGDFDVCVVGTPTAAPTNDEPCDGILMPTVNSACNYATFTNVGATTSSVPAPTSCAGGSGAAQGGFTSGTADVWFKIIVPSTGNINITSEPNLGSGALSDGVMALYSGSSCSSLSQIACSDDHEYPGSAHDLLPMITESGLTPGDTVYLRYFGYGTGQGEFGFCVNTGLNDDCVDALYICDINGYSGSTSAAYTATRPGNMRGNAEQNDPPNYTYTPGTNTGGIFGQGGSWGSGAPNYDVSIENNSWISFTASDVTAVLNVSVYDCYVGNYPSGGIQMQIFDADNCNNFVPVSNFEENSTGFTITANNLTIGNDYYLMVDGYSGDICSYTISANSGVQFPDIPDVPPICVGESTTLTAPSGATSYEWAHNGSTSQSVSVSPSVTTTYTCEVTGLCDYKQTLDVTVEVNPLPAISLSTGNNTTICDGEVVTVTAGGASTYNWSNGQSGNTINVSPSATTTYTVTGELEGCESSEQVIVNVNALPTLTANPSATDADCGLSNGALTGGVVSGNPGYAFEWTNGNGNVVGNALDLTNVSAGLYSLNIIDANSCSDDFGPFSISNPGAPAAPNVTVTSNAACEGEEITFTASATSGASLSWSGPNGFSSSASTFTIPVNSNTDGNYCVVAEESNCVSPSSCETITLNPNPVLNLSSSAQDTTVCAGNEVILTGSGANSLTWSGPNGFSAVGSPINISNTTTGSSGWYVMTGVDGNGCSAQDSVQLDIASLPVADAAANGDASPAFCEGTVGELFGDGGQSYSWSGPDGFSSSNQNVVITDFSTQNEGYYYLEVTDANGCQDNDSVFVESAIFDEVSIDASDSLLCPGDPLMLNATGADVYTWNGPNGFQENGASVSIDEVSVDDSGTYYVTGTSQDGCSAMDSVQVDVIASPDCIFIPEFISPNQDNQNDYWVVTGIENYPEAEVFIYNRWGNLTFYASPYLNDWSGQVNKGVKVGSENGKVPNGTYFYVIKLNDGVTKPFKGYIELQY